MHFEEILDQAIAMLQRRGRVTYRALKRQFNLDDAFLEDLTVELMASISSGKHSPSLATLRKYAEAVGCRLEVRLVRARARSTKGMEPTR